MDNSNRAKRNIIFVLLCFTRWLFGGFVAAKCLMAALACVARMEMQNENAQQVINPGASFVGRWTGGRGKEERKGGRRSDGRTKILGRRGKRLSERLRLAPRERGTQRQSGVGSTYLHNIFTVQYLIIHLSYTFSSATKPSSSSRFSYSC